MAADGFLASLGKWGAYMGLQLILKKCCCISCTLRVHVCVSVTQSSLTLCDPMHCSLPGSCFHGIFQARVLEWVALSYSRDLESNGLLIPIQHRGSESSARQWCCNRTCMPVLFIMSKVRMFISKPRNLSIYNILTWDIYTYIPYMGFAGGSDGKESACSAGDLGSIPGSGRSPGGGNSYPLQYSCLENSMDRGAWQATVHGVAKS